jgi:MoxR-like ATPase
MDEHEVTIEGHTYPLPEPFFFIGTQNPRDQAGTAALPESQVDRFLMRIELGSPERATQRKLLFRDRERGGGLTFDFQSLRNLFSPADLLQWQGGAANIHVSDAVAEYVLDLCESSQSRGWTLSPRAGLGLQRAAQSFAFLNGRSHVLPDDVQAVFLPVVTHRLAQFSGAAGDSREAAEMGRQLIAQTPVK